MVRESNTEIETAEENLTDKYGHEILPWQMFFKGNYLERAVTGLFIYRSSVVLCKKTL